MLIIVFEGLDKSGKTTGIYTAEKYINDKYPHLKTKILSEVGDNSFGLGSELKSILKNYKLSSTAQFYLFAAIRTENKKYLEELSKEYIVLLDRYYLSTLVYQSDVEEYLIMFRDLLYTGSTLYSSIIENTIVDVDGILYFYVDPDELQNRLSSSNNLDSLENKIFDDVEKYQKEYDSVLKKFEGTIPVVRINNNNFESEVSKNIYNGIDLILKERGGLNENK